MSMLAAAEGLPYDYVLNTGDILSHDFRWNYRRAKGKPSGYRSIGTKTLLFVNRMLKKSFPGIPLSYTPATTIPFAATTGWRLAMPCSRKSGATCRSSPVIRRHCETSWSAGSTSSAPNRERS